jgi:hypothetical protein
MTHHDSRAKAPAIFQILAADGAAAGEDQRTLPRRLTMVLAICLVTFAPLLWAVAAQAAGQDAPEAVLSSKQATAADDDDDDDDGTGGGDGTNSNPGTGRETAGNTDRGGQNTGISTRGETDGRDGTGQTERTQGTGRETRGDSDDGGDTGVKTVGDTGGDGTDSNRANGTDTAGGDDD